MEGERLNRLLHDALSNKQFVIGMKNAAAKSGKYEFAAELRTIEREKFPEQKEALEAQESASRLDILFRLLNLSVDPKDIWIILQGVTLYNEKGGKVDIEDASNIIHKANEYFD